MDAERRSIAVIGPGAVGGYFGGRLAEAGHAVVFVTRPGSSAALRRNGLTIDSPLGGFQLPEPQVVESGVSFGPVDVVVVAVKAAQLTEVAPLIPDLLHQGSRVIPLQNGVEAVRLLSGLVPTANLVGGTCKIVALRQEPGRIRHLGYPPGIAMGEVKGPASPGLRKLVEPLTTPGMNVAVVDDIECAIWKKFLFIAAFSGVGAMVGLPAEPIRSDPGIRNLLLRVMNEIAQLAEVVGITLGVDAVAEAMEIVDRLPPDATVSMQRDLMAGRPSELDFQTGAVVRLAAEHGVAVPENQAIFRVLSPREAKARGLPVPEL